MVDINCNINSMDSAAPSGIKKVLNENFSHTKFVHKSGIIKSNALNNNKNSVLTAVDLTINRYQNMRVSLYIRVAEITALLSQFTHGRLQIRWAVQRELYVIWIKGNPDNRSEAN